MPVIISGDGEPRSRLRGMDPAGDGSTRVPMGNNARKVWGWGRSNGRPIPLVLWFALGNPAGESSRTASFSAANRPPAVSLAGDFVFFGGTFRDPLVRFDLPPQAGFGHQIKSGSKTLRSRSNHFTCTRAPVSIF
jgi:hypothetical protein